MIRQMVVAVPRKEIERTGFDPALLDNFVRVTGIKKTRRTELSATQLAIKAAEALWERCPITDVRAVMVVTQSAERNSPCMAVEIHRALGLPESVPAFDVNQSCDGFIYGLWLAAQMKSPCLVVCVDKLRAKAGTLDSLIFSDGACAFVVDGADDLYRPMFYTDGSGSRFLHGDEHGLLCMDGGKTFDFVTKTVPGLIQNYERQFIPFHVLAQHQPNLSMMKLVEKRCGYGPEGTLHCVEEYGNMSMTSIACALAHEEEKVLGKNVLLVGYGAGWSAALMGVKWPAEKITGFRIIEI